MKLNKRLLIIATFLAGACLQGTLAVGSVAVNPPITGTLTASPSSSSIEVDHRTYKIRPNSSAAKAIANLTVGQKVDIIVLQVPGSAVEVISVAPHAGG